MINTWWLALIVPVSMAAGAFCMALAAAGKLENVEIIHCKDCVWYRGVGSNPIEGEHGTCWKTTFNKERPVPTNAKGYCHRAERKEDAH